MDTSYQAPPDLADLIAAQALPALADQSKRWAAYEGTYQIADKGVISPTKPVSRFLIWNGVPYFDTVDQDTANTLVRHRLTEIQPGLFLADNGETLDFRSPQPTWRNLDLLPAQGGPLPWQFGLFGLVVISAIGWVVGGVVAALVRRRRRSAPQPQPIGRRWQWLMSAVALLAVLLALATMDAWWFSLALSIPGSSADSGDPWRCASYFHCRWRWPCLPAAWSRWPLPHWYVAGERSSTGSVSLLWRSLSGCSSASSLRGV